MASKRPALRAVPALDHTRTRQVQREVTSILRRHLEDACARAWAEIGHRFGARMFASSDPSSTAAQHAARALITLLVNGLGRLTLAALMLPPRQVRRGRRRWTGAPPRLAAIPGGLRRHGHAADGWRPESPPSR